MRKKEVMSTESTTGEEGSNVHRVYDRGSKWIFCSSDVVIDEASRNNVSEGIAEESEMEIQLPEVREKGVAERTPETRFRMVRQSLSWIS